MSFSQRYLNTTASIVQNRSSADARARGRREAWCCAVGRPERVTQRGKRIDELWSGIHRGQSHPQCASCMVRWSCSVVQQRAWTVVSRQQYLVAVALSLLLLLLLLSGGCPAAADLAARSRWPRCRWSWHAAIATGRAWRRAGSPSRRGCERGAPLARSVASANARRCPGFPVREKEARTQHVVVVTLIPRSSRRSAVDPQRAMADFDAIYEEEEENEQNLEEHYVAMVPDPIVIRGAGNMTV